MWKDLLDVTWELEFTDKWVVKEPVLTVEDIDSLYQKLASVDVFGGEE